MYMDTSSGDYPLSEQQVRTALPAGATLPRDAGARDAFYAARGFAPVRRTTAPDHDAVTERAVEGTPAQADDGTWHQTWTVEDRPLEEARARVLADLADRRWRVETGGIAWTDSSGNTHSVPTDRDGRPDAREYVKARDGLRPDGAGQKMADGAWVAVSNSDMQALARAVMDHVQAAFDNEGALADQARAAASVADLKAIDRAAGWPATAGA